MVGTFFGERGEKRVEPADLLLHPLLGLDTLTTDLNSHRRSTWHQALARSVVRLLRCIDVYPSAALVSWSIIGFTGALMTICLVPAGRVAFGPGPGWRTATKALALAGAFQVSLPADRGVRCFITFWST